MVSRVASHNHQDSVRYVAENALSSYHLRDKMKFHLIIPSRDCMKFLPRCLDSVADQTRRPDTVTVIDDASTNPSQALFIKNVCLNNGWHCTLNTTNLEVAHNLWRAIQSINPDPDDVIIELDGDDALMPNAVERIAQEYANPDVWCSYGSYQYWPNPDHWHNPALPYPPEVVANRSYRHHNVLFNHPETWRAFLWKRLAPWELQDEKGQWIRRTWDFCCMMPLLELAGTHWRHIPDILYLYTHDNPASHVRLPEHQQQAEHEAAVVKSRRPRDPIPDDHIANPRRKRDMLLKMRDKYGIRTLVETGTGMGDGVEWFYRHFDQMHTIEIDPKSHEAAKQHCVGGVNFILGDSAVELPQLIADISKPTIFFLDGHFSGGNTRGPKDTPIVEELQAIFADPEDHIVVIDDARLFGTDPSYPTVDEVKRMAGPYCQFSVDDDTIVIEPEEL